MIPGMTNEEMRAVYFDADALREPSYRVFRLDMADYRYYYRFNENGVPVFYPSVTTILRATMPTSPQLIDWMIANGKEGSAEKRDIAAAYGTLMHEQFEKLIIERKYDFDAASLVVAAYLERENLPDNLAGEWTNKLRKDVLAFAQFVKDYNVRPLAVEIALVHPVYGYAGCLDLPCMMTDKSGDFAALVDFKSGRKGFYEEHEIQLHMYADMWNVEYPDKPIARVFNFSPKDWRKKPTYNLKEQTGSKSAAKIPSLLALAAIEDEGRDSNVTLVKGSIDLDNDSTDKCIEVVSLADLVSRKYGHIDRTPIAEPEVTPESEPERAEKEAETKSDLLFNEEEF